MLEKIKKIKISEKNTIKIILFLIFISMILLNFLTPLIADDYSYALNNHNARLTGIGDIYHYQLWHYFNWGGRTIAHSLAQLFLMGPKWLFNIFNSICYTIMIYLLYLFGRGKNKKEKPYLLIMLHLLIYYLVPVFGQNCIWLIGSCNYLWTMTFMLLFIYQYTFRSDENNTILRIIIFFLFGIIVGWTNENTAVGLIIIVILLIVLNKPKKWKISGLLGAITGFAFMILAPGNRVRSSFFVDNDFILIKWFKRFIDCTMGIYNYCVPIVIALVILFTIYIYNHKKINNLVYIFLAGSFFSIYSMVMSPTFPERSWFGIVIFSIISITILISEIDNIHKIAKPIIYDIIIISSFFFIKSYGSLLIDINHLRNVWEDRIEYMETDNSEGQIVFEQYYTDNKKNPNYGISDLYENETEWPNYEIACYYGVEDRGITIPSKD